MRWVLLSLGVLVMGGCGKVANQSDCTGAELLCGETCVDPLESVDHCGQCDLACDTGEVCSSGQCAASCDTGLSECGGTCVDTQTDDDNCGACGTMCSADQECRAGQCEVRCDAGLTAAVSDPWGFEWDGLERAPVALDVASTTCAAFGARLPTATELYRVSANQSGAVGMSFHTNALWSAAPADALNQTVLRLSDATATSQLATVATPYRCVCAPPQPASFSGTHCNGPAGSECVSVGRYNVDRSDRPAVRRNTAIWECQNEHAHLADYPVLVEALQAGAPGSGNLIATADQAEYRYSTGIRWTSSTWEVSGNIDIVHLAAATPFRCAGPSFVAGTHAATVPNQFVGAGGAYKGEAVDTAAAVWQVAHDQCFARGGHVPRAAELAELIMQGLPAGSNGFLWSSDQVGYNGTQFLAAVVKWTGLDKRFSYEYPGTSSWDYKTVSLPSRCIYYPVDPMYQAPASCNGGCFDANPTTGPARMTFDSMDRPASTQAAAFATCKAAGGRLASERDLTEAIRAGLPNGTNASLLTSDIGQNNILAVRWAGVDTAYTDQYSTYMTWYSPTTTFGFRCMWTNELR